MTDAQKAPERAQELAEVVGRAMYERDHCAIAHGIELVAIAPGYARMTMTVRKDMVNGHDIGHGGMTFTLADTAFAYACNGANHASMAAQASIVFLDKVREGETLVAEAQEVAREGRAGVTRVAVRGGDGRAVAEFTGYSRTLGGAVVEA